MTGTDGKTTTVNLIFHILREAGEKVSMISSMNAVIGPKKYDTGFHVTTPDPKDVQKFLRQAVDAGSKYFVLESTSHGLSQNRLFGCFFKVGVVTNVTHEHLDYHKTYKNYLQAKAKLFGRAELAVLNKDDEPFKYLNEKLQNIKRVTYALKSKADFTPKSFPFKTPLLGEYNQYNCLAAIAATSSLKIPAQQIKQTLASFRGVEGRMEEIKLGQDFRVIIDFAHTPNALENTLKTLKPLVASRQSLIVVFGCAGLRDIQKRPKMGEIAAKYADLIVLTAEDPRTEDVNQIIDQIVQGCLGQGVKEGTTLFRIPDRGEAIKFAIQKLAKKGDIVVICGKGHEQSMCYGKKEYPWSDFKAVKKALGGLKR